MTIDKAELRRLAEAATPGPWQIIHDKYKHHLGGYHQGIRIFTAWDHPQMKGPIGVVNESSGIGEVKGGAGHRFVSMRNEDAKLIVAARESIPELLDELDAKEREIARLGTKVDALLDQLCDLGGELREPELFEAQQLRKDATRYRRLRDDKSNALHLSRNGDHACNYRTAKEWIEECGNVDEFSDVPEDELEKMKQTNTIWALQVYPNTPVGSWKINGASLDFLVDAVIASEQGKGNT